MSAEDQFVFLCLWLVFLDAHNFSFFFLSPNHCFTGAAFLQSHRAPQHGWQGPPRATTVHAAVPGQCFEIQCIFWDFYWDCQGTPGNPLRSTRVLAAGKGQLREAVATHTPSQTEEAKSLCSIQVTRERVAGSSLRPSVSEALTPAAPRERPAAPLLSGL